ncbi:family 20 glycosylhydrolase [Galbibacter sp. BG1]|uniref:family 20 glycosylhydrolase n=1 Tax=Galbibacter sp. BG1 TaxID=1170699 RepID=UPI0015B8BFD4|nr:family 20 glycosylhydrolase [Galbibacter sp. BG1]QLE02307.1 family 20 glycosylhydrolase [Galbibacter sp. BG1]
MKFIYILLSIVTFLGCTPQEKNETPQIGLNDITPLPQKVMEADGIFSLSEKTAFYFHNEETKQIAVFFKDKILAYTGMSIKLSDEKKDNNVIQFHLEDSLKVNDEGYKLTVDSNKIDVVAKTYRGIFYGMQSVLQLLPIVTKEESKITSVEIPNGKIIDEPTYSWRGMHLDVSRHFFSIEEIKKQLDVLALFKINKFHWHLTDDQGWRIEIKKYPALITKGVKTEANSNEKQYYTQNEVKEVVAYAQERFIDVIPEIETPGHAVAALSAYSDLACNKDIIYQPRELWGVDYNIFCAGNEKVFDFIADVYDEIVPLFPYGYYHAGGDEAPKRNWEKCPQCQKRIKVENLKNEAELQSYFMARVEKIIQEHGKIMIGWDEILEGGITPTTNIMSWQGEEGGIKAANAGHDVIMTPLNYSYLNFSQGDYRVEPMAHGGYIPLEKVYNYSPIPAEIDEDKKKHILGMQGNIWTEYAYTGKDIEYYAYPRIIAIAELTWSGEERKDYNNFLTRLDNLYPTLDMYGINYHIPLPEGPTANGIAFTDSLTLTFNTTHPIPMKYTLDGSKPNENSNTYTEPITFASNAQIKIASLLPTGKVSTVRNIDIKKVKLKEAHNITNLAPGLEMKTVDGHFKEASEVTEKPNESTIINTIADANKTFDWGKEIDTTNFRAVFLKGFVEIPEDGVYYFASKQEQVKISDSVIINPNYTLKRFPLEGTIALKKGMHPIEIIYLNNAVKGWASDWNDVEVTFRKANEENYKVIDSTMIFHSTE